MSGLMGAIAHFNGLQSVMMILVLRKRLKRYIGQTNTEQEF